MGLRPVRSFQTTAEQRWIASSGRLRDRDVVGRIHWDDAGDGGISVEHGQGLAGPNLSQVV
jgi:hypothetical protein